ncbi:unnamed protein product [Aphanomyces euteiches]
MADVKAVIKSRFASKDMGPIHYILGICVVRGRFDLNQAKPATTSLDKALDGSDFSSDVVRLRTEEKRPNHDNFR